ncbi:acyl carrier protein [Streptomyces sp. IBSNAI002]|uniref:acyl carrier protein n=1 Tax=Streptomyces sp. IBSNAI002 TaxID=3457500 RepID=UPI003FD6151E
MNDHAAPAPLPERHALGSVHAELLDCIQVNLAVLADHHHGPDTHLRLGSALRWHTRPGAHGLPTVDPSLDHRIAEAEQLLGLKASSRTRLTGAGLRDTVRTRGTTHYVVADAHAMPWLPYHGRRHMDHSFLLAAGPEGFHVADGYRTETPWGHAVPGHWEFGAGDLAGIGTAEVIAWAPTLLDATAPRPAYDGGDPDAYLAAYAGHPDRAAALEQLASETWLLARARGLHARWRARLSLPVDTEHLRRWDLVVEQSYLAHRRVARGRTEPPGVLDRLAAALAADATAFAVPAPQAAADPALREAVAGIAASVLGAPRQRLLEGAEFTDFQTFSSFRLVELIERVERDLDVELDADELIPENLRRVDDLCQIAIRPRAAAPAA